MIHSTSLRVRLHEGTDRFGRSWRGRRVAVVGLGRSGMAAVQLLRRVGARVCASEAREATTLRAELDALRAWGVQEIELGGHTQAFIERVEAVVTSPGVPESSGPIQWAAERRLPVLSEIELAYRFCPSPVVAVTGTNGKSTAVTLIAEVLKAAGRRAMACGNLGIPFASVVPQLTPETVAVVEVSSFQLIGCEMFRPRIGVLLNIGTNHLDRHHDQAAYLAAKARLFQRQTAEDWAVLNGRDPRIVTLSEHASARLVWFGENRSNSRSLQLAPETLASLTDSAQAVLQVGRLLELPDPLTWQVIRSFRGLEHRLEHVATIRGMRYVNDSKSTTPDSLLFALNRTQGEIVVILGGRDKGLDFHPLVEPLHEPRVKGLVLIGESRQRLRPLLNGSTTVRECPTLESAVDTAAHLAGPGATVLFSPACASFDMFRDYEHRGRSFKAIVHSLAQGSIEERCRLQAPGSRQKPWPTAYSLQPLRPDLRDRRGGRAQSPGPVHTFAGSMS